MNKSVRRLLGYFDGACEPVNPGGTASFGAVLFACHSAERTVLRQESGIAAQGKGASNNVAEYAAVARLLQWVLDDADSCPVDLCGDSKLVVYQLNRAWRVRGGLYVPYYLQAQQLFDSVQALRPLTLGWIPREQNALADQLSKQVLIDSGVEFRIQPESI